MNIAYFHETNKYKLNRPTVEQYLTTIFKTGKDALYHFSIGIMK